MGFCALSFGVSGSVRIADLVQVFEKWARGPAPDASRQFLSDVPLPFKTSTVDYTRYNRATQTIASLAIVAGRQELSGIYKTSLATSKSYRPLKTTTQRSLCPPARKFVDPHAD